MKTNQIMERELGKLKVSQRTKDGYFDANSLAREWNAVKDNPQREVSRFLESPKTKEFLSAIEQDSQLTDVQSGEFKPVIIIKGRNTKKGRTKDSTWMHPYLFLDFAMWINPKFKLEVIKFVNDQLIQYRHNAGDNYKLLSNSGSNLNGYDYRKAATAIQWIVFNKKGKNLRNKATQQQLKEISDIEKKLSFSIDMGYIKDFDGLIKAMRKMWEQKYAVKNPITQ